MNIRLQISLGLIIGVLLTGGCRKTIITVPPPDSELGWIEYAAGDYEAAIEFFNEATIDSPDEADGWSGLGWSYAELGEPTQSLNYFTTALLLRDGTVVGTDVLAGLTFTYVDLGHYPEAVVSGLSAVGRSPSWVFSHDNTVTHHDLKVSLAVAYFGTGEFAESLSWVQSLRPTFDADVASASGRAELALEIEILSTIY